MSDDSYLVVSYLAVLAIVVAASLACVGALRASLTRLTRRAAHPGLARLLRTCFPPGIILPALTGMLSVSFVSCERNTYREIVADRAYLVHKNQEQLATSLHWLLVALAIWSLLCAVVLIRGRVPPAHADAQSLRTSRL